MVQVQFNGESGYRQSKVGAAGTPKMIAWLMRMGFAKNTQQANLILIIVAIVAAALAIYIVMSRTSTPPPIDDFETLPGFEEEFIQ